MGSFIVTFLLFAFIIGVVVIIHEFGHFLAAKISDIEVEEFSFGFGPKLYAKKIGETDFMIKLFPIGGYLKLLGEEEAVDSERSFSEKGTWPKMLVAVSGVFMNLMLAVVLFYFVVGFNGFSYRGIPYYEDLNLWFGDQSVAYTQVIDVLEDTPADRAGLPDDFEMVSIDGEEISNLNEAIEIIQSSNGQEIDIGYKTVGSDIQTKTVEVGEDGMIGIEFSLPKGYKSIRVEYEGSQRFFSGFLHTLNMVQVNYSVLGRLIGQSVEEGSVEPAASNVTGPVGLFAVVYVIKQFGVLMIVDLIASLNLVLAVMNLLPLPALDGGHTVIIFIEELRGKPVNEKVKNWIFGAGFVFFLVLAAVIAVKDVVQFGIFDWIKSIF